jgi:hypothetical protein
MKRCNLAPMTAGHNVRRGSGSDQIRAFDNASTQVGCPVCRIDRLCITCCSPSHITPVVRRSRSPRKALRVSGAARLRRRMADCTLTRCETIAEPLVILLWRFATELAREEARMLCDELMAEEAIALIRHDLIAA